MKLPKEWKCFLMNDKNKKLLTLLLLAEWQKDSYALLLGGRELYFACDHQCFVLSRLHGHAIDSQALPDIASSQEGADSLLLNKACMPIRIPAVVVLAYKIHLSSFEHQMQMFSCFSLRTAKNSHIAYTLIHGLETIEESHTFKLSMKKTKNHI